MFGSNFDANFGIPSFPFQGMDPQGGLLGTNVPPQSDPAAAGTVPTPGGPTSTQPPAAGAPATPAPPALGSPSPLATGALAPGASPSDQSGTAAPAAGVGSPFGKPAQ